MADNMSDDDFQQKLKELGYSDDAMAAASSPAPVSTDTSDMDKLDQARLQAAQAKPQPAPASAPMQPQMSEGQAEERAQSASGAPLNLPEVAPSEQQPEQPQASAPAPMPAAQPASASTSVPMDKNQLESNPELNDQALKDAQQKAGLGQLIANIGNAGSTFSALASGAKPEEEFYNNLGKQAQRPVEDIQARRQAFEKNIAVAGNIADVAVKKMNAQQQQQLNDPQSGPSQFIKSILANQYSQQKDANGKLVDITKSPGWSDLSGADALDFQKMLASQEHIQALRDQLQFRGQLNQQKVDTHATDKQNAAGQKLSQALNTFRGDTAAQQANLGLLNSDKAMALINSSPNLDNLSPQQEALLRSEVAKIATGGAATQASTHDIQAKTLQSRAAQFWQQVSGNPTGAQLGGFIQQNKDYLKHLNDVNHEYIDTKRQNILNDYKGQVPEETYNDFYKRYLPNRAEGEGNSPKAVAAAAPSSQGPQYGQDVLDYAQQHKITPDQALSIKQQRTGAQ